MTSQAGTSHIDNKDQSLGDLNLATRNDLFEVSNKQDREVDGGDYTFNKCNSPEFSNESSVATGS